jgi:hypothetical protein
VYGYCPYNFMPVNYIMLPSTFVMSCSLGSCNVISENAFLYTFLGAVVQIHLQPQCKSNMILVLKSANG